MTISFRPAVRENVPLLIGVAGGTGSGKTYSALLLARGIANGQPFAFVDTENGRGRHYADLFPEMMHGEIHAPFRPEKYADAIVAGAKDYPVVVVDSMSHEWAGDGGCLDWHDELAGGDPRKNLAAWIEPKRAHKKMVTRLLQVNAHVILCFRAEPKVEAVKRNGRLEYVPKASLTGLDGWLPVSEKMLPFELTASFLLMAEKPGVPRPIKLQEQHRDLVPLDRPLDAGVGVRLAAWAAGTSVEEPKAVENLSVPVSTAALASEPSSSADPLLGEDAPTASPPSSPEALFTPPTDKPATAVQKKKLNVLVGQLRDEGHITTEQLYGAVGVDAAQFLADDGLHWSPLREVLTQHQAHSLIDRLERYQANLAGSAA